MSNFELKTQAMKVLTDLGFTATQARAYFALCQLGISNAKTISKESKIARQDIYRVLAGLEEMGFIEKALTKPAMFQSLPLQETIDVMMKRRKDKSHELWEKTQKLLKKLEAKGKRPAVVSEKPQFILIPEGRAYLHKGKEAIAAVQTSIDCITSYKSFLQMMHFASKDITEAMQRGVKLRFILDKPITEMPLPKIIQKYCKTGFYNIRSFVSYSPPGARIAIYDKKEAQIAISTNENFMKSSMLLSTCPQFVSIINDYFETLWCRQSKDFESAEEKREIETSI